VPLLCHRALAENEWPSDRL